MIQLLILALQLGLAVASVDGSLYIYKGATGPIKEYTGTKNDFHKSRKPRVVDFYSPHCPVCIEFKDEYIHLATRMQEKYPSVEFYAVSCSAHDDACRAFDIEGTPSLWVFQEGSDQVGMHIDLEKEGKERYTPSLLADKLHLKPSVAKTTKTKGTDKETAALQSRAARRMDDRENFDLEEGDDNANDETGGEANDDAAGDDTANDEAAGDDNANDEAGSDDNANDEAAGDDKANDDATGDDTLKNEDGGDDNGNDEASDDAVGQDNADGDDNANDEAAGDDDANDEAAGDDNANDEAAGDDKANDDATGDDTLKNEAGGDDNDNDEAGDDAVGEDNADGDDDANDDAAGDDNAKDEAAGDDDANDEDAGDDNANDDAADDDNVASGFNDKHGMVMKPFAAPPAMSGDDDLSGDEDLGKPFVSTPVRDTSRTRTQAGHQTAKQLFKEMDRFKHKMKEKQEEYARKRKGLGRFIRHDNRKDKRGNWKPRLDPEEMTKGMKVASPGTAEYRRQREQMRKYIEKGHKKMKISKEVSSRATIKKESLPYRKEVRKQGFVKRATARVPVIGQRFMMTQEETLILDTSIALYLFLEEGVFSSNKPLGMKDRQALGGFLDLLNISLPPEWGIHRLIDELRRRFSYIIQSKQNLQQVLNKHPLPRRKFSASCHSNRSQSGFTCGAWKLFHVATVGVAEHRGGHTLMDSQMVAPETRLFSPIDAANTIRNFVDSFLMCEHCRKNFVNDYDDCEKHRRCDRLTDDDAGASTADWKELPVWLWEVHNEVSLRIVEENNQGVKHAKTSSVRRKTIQEPITAVWPNIETCFLCFHEDGTWDEGEIFSYLEKSYWPDSVMDPKSERLIRYDGDNSMGLNVLFWLVMLAFVGGFYALVGAKSPGSVREAVYRAKLMANNRPGKKE